MTEMYLTEQKLLNTCFF